MRPAEHRDPRRVTLEILARRVAARLAAPYDEVLGIAEKLFAEMGSALARGERVKVRELGRVFRYRRPGPRFGYAPSRSLMRALGNAESDDYLRKKRDALERYHRTKVLKGGRHGPDRADANRSPLPGRPARAGLGLEEGHREG